MARPKHNAFFEDPLSSNLSESEKWLSDYHHHSKTLVEYLLQNGAQNYVYYTTINCLTKLRTYLLQEGMPYTSTNAALWFDSEEKHPKGYKITLFRLADLYKYDEIQPVNAFPHALSYEKNLMDPWRSILADFKSSLSVSDRTAEAVKNCVSRFLYRIQEKGIVSPSNITFDLLEKYFQEDGHRSEPYIRRYTYAVGDIMLFMADNGMCDHGLGWYPYFKMHNRIFRISNFTEEQITALDTAKSEDMVLSAEEYAALVPDFLNDFKTFGYRKTPCKTAFYVLHNLLLFMEMHDLGYNKAVADVWLEHEKTYHKNDTWKSSRRILNLFRVYVDKRTILPEIIFTEKPLLCENLPLWCREELDSYLTLKTREGWKKSTLDMIRSSVTRFCSFLTDIGIEGFSDVTPEILKNFNICDSHNSAEGKNAYNSRIRKFLRYLERKDVLPYGIHKALPAASAPGEKIVVTLTEDEKTAIQKKQNNCNTSLELRDRVVMLIGTKMGLRASDVVTIRLTDIDWKKQTLRVMQEKTRQEILLPIPTDVANAIYLYIRNGRPNEKTSEKNLLIKNRAPHSSLTRSVCRAALKRTLPDRKIPGSGFHVTRKTFATDRLRNGVGKQMIADLLGHKDTQSLNHYLLLDEERMRMCPISLADAGLTMEDNRYDNV